MELDQEPENTGKNNRKRRNSVAEKDHVVLARGPEEEEEEEEEASIIHLEQCQQSSARSRGPWAELLTQWAGQWVELWVEQWVACLMLPMEQCRGSLETAACQEKYD